MIEQFNESNQVAGNITINGEIIPFLFKKEIIHLPKSLIVGKKVTYPIAKQGKKEEDGGNPSLNLLWKKCREDGTRDYLLSQKTSMNLEALLGFYFDINKNEDGNFSYIVGSLMRADFIVPEGFDCHEVGESEFAVCWYKYKTEDDIWSVAHGTVEKYMEEQGYKGTGGCSELYMFDEDEVNKGEAGYNILGYLIACQKKNN